MTTTTTMTTFMSTKLSRAQPPRLDSASSSHRNPSSPCQRLRLGNVAVAARLQVRAQVRANRDDQSKLAGLPKSALSIPVGALVMAMVEQPALAVTGVNYEEELSWVITQIAIVAFWYFFIMPPIIMNWLRVRWYRRKLLEMYLQFMFVFMFFPGMLLWAPFLNMRKFPRDPSLKYPWSEPEDPSQVKNGYLKYPFAQPEDYD
ncbi:hypothetical protein MLD38_007531 [Melastoma candidum]|uniref:Uncharacterized protein n=1 Tax=Melastoma candidum TaxID=119954 RepID=A0ACB9RR46_9MYRT|nr:hypothetical protein MLD38_007531 [Melastoma candidum]